MSALSARKNDAVIALCQNNEERAISVSIANQDAAKMLGYTDADALKGLGLDAILPEKLMDVVEENVEFEPDSHDVDQVFLRMRDFALKHKDGHDLPCEMKVARLPTTDMNHYFRLVLKDERSKREENMLLRSIHDRMAGYAVMQEPLGLPDAASTEKCLGMALPHVSAGEITACFVMIRLDRYEKSLALYGADGVAAQLAYVVQSLRQNLREDDIVCALGEGYIGIILFNIPHEAIRVVLNRLRWYIASKRFKFGGKEDFSITISLTYKPLKGDENPAEVMSRCRTMMEEMSKEDRGALDDGNAE